MSSSSGLSLAYNAKNQTTNVNGTTMSYADADQTRRVDAGDKHFTYNQLGLGTEKDASGTTSFTRDNEGTLVSMREPAGTSYYLLDGLASVVAVTSAVGDVAKRYEYEPYGQAIPTTGSHANPWRFASGYLDAGSSFYKFGTRYYVPSLARWTQHDPARGTLSNPLSLNPYVYVGDNPVNYTDPSGTHIASERGGLPATC